MYLRIFRHIKGASLEFKNFNFQQNAEKVINRALFISALLVLKFYDS